MTKHRNISIVGIGPRGHFALENLVLGLYKKQSLKHIHIRLFEATNNFGNGPIYRTEQIDSNWINISERILRLDKREAIHIETIEIPEFPSYHEWSPIIDSNKDQYPPRSKIGTYLQQRFTSLITPLVHANIVTLHNEKVIKLHVAENKSVTITTSQNCYTDNDDVLVTIGHQPTEPSKQIETWDTFSSTKNRIVLFKNPYPIETILSNNLLKPSSTIGVRGFGLAMIDIVRAVANKFGHFSIEDAATMSCSYHTSYSLENLLIPFSLDGQPPVPKPLNGDIDVFFKPSDEELMTFEKTIGNPELQKEATGPEFLIEAFSSIAARVFEKNNPEIEKEIPTKTLRHIIECWLLDPSYQHYTILSTDQTIEVLMCQFVKMATLERICSLDYCVGQVWRHCQPSIYKSLSHNACSDEVIAEIIGIDETTKRYSYGPPVESIQQLLALSKSGILNLKMTHNPTIKLQDNGWIIKLNNSKITANIMINSVLDAPNISAVNSSIIKNMLCDDLIQPVYSDLGIVTDRYGYIISKEAQQNSPIALLGRLAKGTVIGVDAILECFGERPKNWAYKAVEHHINWLKINESTQ